MATTQRKIGTPPGGGNWAKLENAGDVRRFLRWCILQTKADKLDTRQAGVLGQLGLYLLKTLEASDFEHRLERIEHALQAAEMADRDTGNSPTTH